MDKKILEDYIDACELIEETEKDIQRLRKKQKPKKVKIKAWSPARCPSCDYELSTNVGDGYYKHPIFLERCPQCSQKLDWSEEE